MAKKADLELDRDQYFRCLGKAREAMSSGSFDSAVDACLESLDHVDGMMQFEQKYADREFKSVETIDVLLRLAPLIFHRRALDLIADKLKQKKRIDRDASDDLAARLDDAHALLKRTHRLWGHLVNHPGFRQDNLRVALGGDQDEWRSICESWQSLGLMTRIPSGGSYELYFVTEMDGPCRAKCPKCGMIAYDQKQVFLEPRRCDDCGGEGCEFAMAEGADQ